MANFVLVMTGVSAEEMEKIFAIQVRSENKLRFVPQGVSQQGNSVGSSSFMQQQISEGNPPKLRSIYNNVRLEWDEHGSKFANEVFHLFVKEEHQEQKAG